MIDTVLELHRDLVAVRLWELRSQKPLRCVHVAFQRGEVDDLDPA